jgi:hypothetical protein
MITFWPYPGSATVSCGIGEHKCRGDNCSCDCHLQGHAIPAAMRLTAAQEIRFEAFINQAFRVKVE